MNPSDFSGELKNSELSLTEMSDAMLADARELPVTPSNSICLPISQIATLGAGVSQLIPQLNTITQSASLDVSGLYRIANLASGDVLKVRKAGNFWGALKTLEGKSKMTQLAAADPITMTSKISMGVNPALIMMAVALFSIEQELGNIADMQKKILSFLEIEKTSEIEADVITLTELVNKYKHNWDNERYVTSNHKFVCDIQRTARKNMLAYQKQVSEVISEKSFLPSDGKVNGYLQDLIRKFKYYRLSQYTFALSSLTEIMLSGNFKEENINIAIAEIEKNAEQYRSLFGECSVYLEKTVKGAMGTNLRKLLGVTSTAMGQTIQLVPGVKIKPVNDFLVAQGEKLNDGAEGKIVDVVSAFSEVRSPNTLGFVYRLKEINRIYNKTEDICFDNDNVYLLTE